MIQHGLDFDQHFELDNCFLSYIKLVFLVHKLSDFVNSYDIFRIITSLHVYVYLRSTAKIRPNPLLIFAHLYFKLLKIS